MQIILDGTSYSDDSKLGLKLIDVLNKGAIKVDLFPEKNTSCFLAESIDFNSPLEFMHYCQSMLPKELDKVAVSLTRPIIKG